MSRRARMWKSNTSLIAIGGTKKLIGRSDDRNDHVWTIGNQAIDAPSQQPAGVVFRIHRPHLDAELGTMGRVDEAGRYDMRAAGPLGHLVATIRDPRNRPADPASIERPAHLFARRAGRHRRFEAPRLAEHAQAERPETHPVDRRCRTHDADNRARKLGAVDFQLGDDGNVAVTSEHRGKRRHAEALSAKWKQVAAAEMTAGVGPRQLV